MTSLLSATMTGLVIMALSTPGIAARRIPGAPVRSSRNGRMVPSGHGRSPGFLESGPTIKEYARHLGHADLLRERLDGVTGE